MRWIEVHNGISYLLGKEEVENVPITLGFNSS